jgi:hypothetical protein
LGFDYSPLIIFLSRFNSSNISSLSELNPPPACGAAGLAVAGGAAPGAFGGPLVGGPVGLLTNVGAFGGPASAPGAFGGPDVGGPPLEGGRTGAGGKLGFLGGPPPGGFGGAPTEGGVLGGAVLLGGALGGPPLGGAGAADTGGADGFGAGGVPPEAGPLPLNKLNNVLAAAVFASPLDDATIFFEDVLTVLTSSPTVTSFKSFCAFAKDLIKSLIPFIVSSRSSANDVKPFFIKLITRSNFFCSFETTFYSIPLLLFKI